MILSLVVLLSLKLLEELLVAHENTVRVNLLLGLSGKEFGSRVPSDRFRVGDTGVEWLEAGALGTLLLTKLIRSVTEHDSLIVSNAGLRHISSTAH